MKKDLKILQLHASYSSSDISGENSSVEKISNLLSEHFSIDSHVKSTGLLKKSNVAFLYHAFKFLVVDIELLKKAYKYDLILVHNINPYFSSLTLRILASLFRKRIFLFWHNSRRFCINGMNFRSGKTCHSCQKKNKYLQGIFYKCYRNSVLGSIMVSYSEIHMRRLSKYHNVTNIVFSDFYKQKLIRFGIKLSNIEVVPHSIDTKSTYNIERHTAKDFISIGRLDVEKGFGQLLLAWSKLTIDEKKGSKLHIVGTGPLEKKLVDSFAAKDVVFWGKQDFRQILEISKSCSTGIVTSQVAESFCKVVIEMYLMGLPVIGTPMGSLPELISQLDKNLILQGVDEISIKHGILHRIDNPQDYGNQPQQIIFRHYSEDVWINNMRKLIRND